MPIDPGEPTRAVVEVTASEEEDVQAMESEVFMSDDESAEHEVLEHFTRRAMSTSREPVSDAEFAGRDASVDTVRARAAAFERG